MDFSSKTHHELASALAAIDGVQAIIWFKPDGTILEANENFCAALGYSADEIVGKHHSMFCDPSFVSSPSYQALWDKVGKGEAIKDKFKRITKTGSPIYIEASYNPIRNEDGVVEKVVKFAVDVTENTNREVVSQGKLEAMGRGLALIEFEPSGTIQWANDNFLSAMGYRLDEIQGQHHRIFVDPTYAESNEYKDFWENLRAGGNAIDEFQRFGKGGKEVWIQAGYNPIRDSEGNVLRVLKYATDITATKHASRNLGMGLNALSEGNLSFRLSENMPGEFAKMGEAFNSAISRLEELVSGILETSSGIANESAAIAGTAKDLSNRCETQAATVEETSAAMEQMSAAVKSTAQNAEDATASARNARKHAEKGSEVVLTAIEAMDRIKDGSAEVRSIIAVIDSIAFQTNLLALNAGVEAARAGEAGRGFAVVASEVRALAQRASDSARDINELIDASGRDVEAGAKLVSNSGDVLKEIVTAVVSAADGIENIFAASQEQAAGVNEITQAITSIDGSTQQTAAIAEESTAAAESLSASAAALQSQVEFFKPDSGDAGRFSQNEKRYA